MVEFCLVEKMSEDPNKKRLSILVFQRNLTYHNFLPIFIIPSLLMLINGSLRLPYVLFNSLKMNFLILLIAIIQQPMMKTIYQKMNMINSSTPYHLVSLYLVIYITSIKITHVIGTIGVHAVLP